MSWLRIQFRVDSAYFDSLSNVLEACLAQSVTIENDGQDEFFEVAFPGRPTWQHIKVSALFPADVDAESIVDFVNQTLFADQAPPVIVEQLQDQDWERVWLSQFQPFHIAGDLWVCPSWVEPPEPEAINVILDPGLAFGTGTHETTFLCLQWLATHDLKGKTVLDYGAGSGILAIAALLVGADQAVATDVDPLAVKATLENAERNKVAGSLQSLPVSEMPSSSSFDLVIANILADVLVDLSDTLADHVAEGGTLLLSGLLSSQLETVEKAFANQFVLQHHVKGDWALVTGVKKT